MTLKDLSEAMASNTGVTVELLNADGDTLIKYNAEGYASVESDILARTVKRVKIKGGSAITVTIADAADDGGGTDPTDP